MPRKLAMPPDAIARQNMLKEVCKNPPTSETTPAVDDRKPSSNPPHDHDEIAVSTQPEERPRA
jgi:hypothetical protein